MLYGPYIRGDYVGGVAVSDTPDIGAVTIFMCGRGARRACHFQIKDGSGRKCGRDVSADNALCDAHIRWLSKQENMNDDGE